MTTGLNDMLGNMNAAKDINVQGLVAAGLLIKSEAQRICPVGITSNLIQSAYVDNVVNESTYVQSVEVGFQASYAPFVHEMLETTNWQKPTAENKFLEKSLMNNESKVLALVGSGISQMLSQASTGYYGKTVNGDTVWGDSIASVNSQGVNRRKINSADFNPLDKK